MKTYTGSKKNKGFSLVEVLVAMTVLALVVAPMAALFTSSVRMNMVSKHRMNAITLAEDLMEALKSNNIATICYQFQYPGDFKLVELDGTVADTSTDPGTVLPKMVDDGMGGTTVAKDSDGNPIFNFKPNSSGIYTFSLTNVTVQQNRETYDAEIEMNTNKYKTAGADPSKLIDFNTNPMVTIAAVKGDENMPAVRSGDDDENTFINMIAEAASEGHTGVTESDIKRTFTVQIDSAESANAGVSYKDKYGYVTKGFALNTFTAKTKTEESEEGEGEGKEPDEGEPGGGGGAGSEEKIPLENVFLFYTPNYYSKGTAANMDTFEINNNSGKEINVYIVKQENGNYVGFDNDEKLYRMAIKIVNGTGSTTYIKSNINYNMAHDYDDTVDAQISSSSITGPASLTVNGAVPSSDNLKKLWTDLAGTQTKDKFYDVTIKVYKSADAAHTDPVYTLTGSTQE